MDQQAFAMLLFRPLPSRLTGLQGLYLSLMGILGIYIPALMLLQEVLNPLSSILSSSETSAPGMVAIHGGNGSSFVS